MSRKSLASILIVIIFLCVLCACRTGTNQHATTNEGMPEHNILFVNLRIFTDADGKEQIELISKTWTTGKLKTTMEDNSRELTGKLLICEFLDEDKKLLSSLSLQNPLTLSAEQYSTDGSIKRQEATLTSANFTIRHEVSSAAAYLQVNNEKGKRLSLLVLK